MIAATGDFLPVAALFSTLPSDLDAMRQNAAELLSTDADVALTEMVVMEVLAGAASDEHLSQLRARPISFPILYLEGLGPRGGSVDLPTVWATGHSLHNVTGCLTARTD